MGGVSGVVSAVGWPLSLTQGFVDCDVGVFSMAVEAVSTGSFTGGDAAKLLERLTVRLEVVVELSSVAGFPVSEQTYVRAVRDVEEAMGLSGTVLRDDVLELSVISSLFSRAVDAPRGAVLGSDVMPGGFVTVAGGSVAVWSHGVVSRAAPAPTQFLLTQRIYRALLDLAVAERDGVPAFHVATRSDGVHVFVEAVDVLTPLVASSLPDGCYELPGAYGCLVSRRAITSLLEAIWVTPARENQEGYCYLRVVPPDLRSVVARAMGPFPLVSSLTAMCPGVYSWGPVEAKVAPVQDGLTHSVSYHVSTVGTLPPDIPFDAVLGGESVRPPHFEAVFSDFEKRFATPPIEAVQSVRSMSPARSDVAISRPHARSASLGTAVEGKFVVPRSATPVFHLQPGGLRNVGPVWTEYPDAASREWANRLASGPPLGGTVLAELSRSRPSALPRLPVGEGGRMVMVPSSQVVGYKVATWRAMSSPIPGWTFEILAPTSSLVVQAVPPKPGILARYEVSAVDPFEIGGLVMPGHRTLFWADGAVTMSRLGRHASVWRMWHEAGASALGPDLVSLHISYQYPVVVPVRRDKLQTLCATLYASDDVRGESLYRASCRALAGESEVRVYVADVVSSEAVVLTVSAFGLVQILLHGVVLPAVAGTVSCVTDLAELVLTCCVANGLAARKTNEVVFEVRRTRGIGVSRAKVQGAQLMLGE
jgi:hypothetical protein